MKRFLTTVKEMKNGELVKEISRMIVRECDAEEFVRTQRRRAHTEMLNELIEYTPRVSMERNHIFRCEYGYEFWHYSLPNHSFTASIVKVEV